MKRGAITMRMERAELERLVRERVELQFPGCDAAVVFDGHMLIATITKRRASRKAKTHDAKQAEVRG
jgi:hypothetical protein